MLKKYRIPLSEHERGQLYAPIQEGNASVRTVRRAHTLLLADEQRPTQMIAAVLRTSAVTVTQTCKRLLSAGLEAALYDQSRLGARRHLDGRQEAIWWRSPVVPRQRDGNAGACDGEPTVLTSAAASRPSPLLPSGGCEKNHAQAVVKGAAVPPRGSCRVRCPHGRTA